MRHHVSRIALVCLVAELAAASLSADTLVLRDGRRVDGVLVSVRDGTIEFQERGGRRRVLRLQRDEVQSIELDSSDPFFIGDDRGAIRLQNSGRLYLGINDDVLTDNRGSFRVLVF